jgi:iron complex outermembrane receptor protein
MFTFARRVVDSIPLCSVLASLLAAPGFAQVADGKQSASGIEEIIVTATRREASLQDIPVSVTAFTGGDLTERAVGNLADVGNFVPNLQFDISTQGPRTSFVAGVFIRGIGEPDSIVTTDPGVGIYVDDVYFGRATGAVLDMLDIERVEVLRGPQGTLFGKNTIGGALNVSSAKPTEEFGGTAELTYGRFDRIKFRGDANVPLSDNVFARFAILANQSDGYGSRLDFATGEKIDEVGEDDKVSGRARLRWIVNEDLEANFSFDYSRVRETQIPNDIAQINPAAPLLGIWNLLVGGPSGMAFTPALLTESDYQTYATGPNVGEMDLWGVNLTLNWEIGPFTVKSITAYRDLDVFLSVDGDGSPARVLGTEPIDTEQDQISQELQIFGQAFDGRLDWLAGFYYFEESAVETTGGFVLPGIFQALEALPVLIGPAGPIGPCPPPPGAAMLPTPGPLGCMGNPNNVPLDLDFFGTNDVDITNYSGFTQGTFSLTDQWSITAGVRFTHEKKTNDIFYMRRNSGFLIAPPGTVLEESWNAWTPRAGFEFKPNDNLLFYFAASRGFRSGGFNGRPFFPDAVDSFDPEYVWAYELGVKSEWFDRRLVLNAAGFFNDYTDKQLSSARATADGNVAVVVENGGEAEMIGFELELHARPIENLDLIAGVGYIDAEFTSIAPGATITEDTQFVKTPDWDVNLGAQYRWPLAALGTLTARVDWAYRSEYYNDVNNTPELIQDPVGLLNARLAFDDPSETWQLAVFGTNLTDEHRISAGLGALNAIGFNEVQYGRRLEWGVSLTYRF